MVQIYFFCAPKHKRTLVRTARTHAWTHAKPPYYKIIAGFQLTTVSITLMIAMAPVEQKTKKYDLKFNLSVVKYA